MLMLERVAQGSEEDEILQYAIQEDVKAARRARAVASSRFYDTLAKHYNELAIGDVLKVMGFEGPAVNIGNVMRGRGLEQGQDFESYCFRKADKKKVPGDKDEGVTIIRRMSEKTMRTVGN
jgi:hypothetical protein